MEDGLPVEGFDEEAPALPEDVRRHLGHLLAVAYAQRTHEHDATFRFANLLAQLDVALEGVDQRLVAAFQAELLAAAPALLRFAISLTRNRVAADDLVQDTMLRAWRSQAGFIPGTNLEAWTFTIMRNQFYSGHRRRTREVQDEDGAQAAKLATPPEQGGQLDLQDVRAALDRLAPAMREALILVTLQNLSYEEAAAVMGCAIGTVKSRVWRAREQLTRVLGYKGDEVGPSGVVLSVMGAKPAAVS